MDAFGVIKRLEVVHHEQHLVVRFANLGRERLQRFKARFGDAK